MRRLQVAEGAAGAATRDAVEEASRPASRLSMIVRTTRGAEPRRLPMRQLLSSGSLPMSGMRTRRSTIRRRCSGLLPTVPARMVAEAMAVVVSRARALALAAQALDEVVAEAEAKATVVVEGEATTVSAS